jgi:hypothetical protein
MVWKDTKQVGCGTASSSTLEVLVCRYSPPGNYLGQFPYNTGQTSANQAVTDEQSTFAPGQGNNAGVNTNEQNSGNNNGELGEGGT